MIGLSLSEKYYNEYGHLILSAAEELCPGLSSRISAGLAGEGSQCFGYDDAVSQDHDFAPGFCIWMAPDDFSSYGAALQAVYDSLPGEFDGFSRQNIIARDRLGILSSDEFYGRFISSLQHDDDWLLIPEANLAAAANGQIWKSGCTQFDDTRKLLLNFYPESVLRKKLAARAAIMSQAGQYNLPRMLERSDHVAAALSAARFTEAAISMVHLLCRRYTPFYKWAFRSLSCLAEESPLAQLTALELSKLPEACILPGDDGKKEAFRITETICAAAAAELNAQGFSETQSSFLQDHLADISRGEDFTYGYI